MAETILYIKQSEQLYSDNFSSTYPGDSGINLIVPENTVIEAGKTAFVSMKIQCMMTVDGQQTSYLLLARSSISKTPLILHNGIGLIDAGYRGDIIAALHNIGTDAYIVTKGSSLVQICAPNLQKIKCKIVDELDLTVRGERGFGSSN